jgi:predicted transposase YdaD
MLTTEWKLDDAIAVNRVEASEEKCFEIARNALAKGYSIEAIHDITGLDFESIENLVTEQ